MKDETEFLRDTPSIGVGILGYGFASRAHIIALKRIREVYWPPSVLPQMVTEGTHPYFKEWWPTGHTLGWEHTFIHEFQHFLGAIVKDTPVEPWGATLEDGYRNVVICDAMLESAELGKKVEVVY